MEEKKDQKQARVFDGKRDQKGRRTHYQSVWGGYFFPEGPSEKEESGKKNLETFGSFEVSRIPKRFDEFEVDHRKCNN